MAIAGRGEFNRHSAAIDVFHISEGDQQTESFYGSPNSLNVIVRIGNSHDAAFNFERMLKKAATPPSSERVDGSGIMAAMKVGCCSPEAKTDD